ncbi:MAG: hypothetical protein WAK95_04380 [Desulfobacterales bacterium]
MVPSEQMAAAAALEDAAALPWRQVAWNGVRFDTPADWEIGHIGHRHLLLETTAGPVLEVKWGPVKGKYSLRRQLKQLAASQGRGLRGSLREERLPAYWGRVLARYESLGFGWQSGALRGRGVLLYCPGCRLAIMLQFFETTGQPAFTRAGRVLASLDDHDRRPVTLWAVFDIRALVPTGYRLEKFRFDAGCYTLSFTNRQSRLSLLRWSPAAVLLVDGGLEGFEKRSLGWSAAPEVRFKKRSPEAMELEEGPPGRLSSRWCRRLQRRPLYFSGRLWHEVEKNRILGARLEGRKPIDAGVLEGICETYMTV